MAAAAHCHSLGGTAPTCEIFRDAALQERVVLDHGGEAMPRFQSSSGGRNQGPHILRELS